MSKAYNLLDESWLPVVMVDGSVRSIGLLELFARAQEIRELGECSPPSLVAEYRLLLAIVHRSLTATFPEGWKDRDRARWYREGLPAEAVHRYLEQWRERFWVFHPEHPFMQVAALATAQETRDRAKSWTQISLASATGNAPMLADHSFDGATEGIEPGFAMRLLLGFLQFTPGGLVKVIRGSDNAGALANSAACLSLGRTLDQTLSLCLHPASRSGQVDTPAWEHAGPTIEALRSGATIASGTNDRYTRQSRSVLLNCGENCCVERIRFGAGLALAEDAALVDPMVSYRAGSDKLVRLSFRDGKAFWRDLSALLPDATGTVAQPAAVLGWAVNLLERIGEQQCEQTLLVAGVTSDQAKIVRWRVERVVLPLALLADASLAESIRREMQRGEDSYKQFRKVAAWMIAQSMPDPKRRETLDQGRLVIDAGPLATTFFSVLEVKFARLLERIAAGELDEAEALWSRALSRALRSGWDVLIAGMGRSAPALRAAARGYPRYRVLLRKLDPEAKDEPKITEVAE